MVDFFKHSSLTQLFRYGVVGVISNLIGYLLYLLITYCGAPPKFTMSILYLAGTAIGFWGNRQWTFAYGGSFLSASARYVVTHFLGYLLNLTILLMMVDHWGVAHQFAQATAIIFVAGFLFLAFKFFVFSTRLRR